MRWLGVCATASCLGAPAAAASLDWSIEPTPNQRGASYSELEGVSCSSVRACAAVGYYRRGQTFSMAERWNGKKWTIERTPNPSGATYSALAGVTCTTPRACTAVGSYQERSERFTLAERWNGTEWTVERTPNPSGATYSALAGVTCTAPRACVAVGSYENDSGKHVTLAEAWNGEQWNITPTPNPGRVASFLFGLSCTSSRACTAVGYYLRGAVKVAAFAERWNGKRWMIESMPMPAEAVKTLLYGVSCTTANACTAVGSYEDRAGRSLTLAERWNGKRWTIEFTPTPAGAVASVLYSVSCSAASVCSAVGPYRNSGGKQSTLAERWNGDRWSVQHTPSLTGAILSCLYGLACTPKGACTAVGHYKNRTGRSLTLTELQA